MSETVTARIAIAIDEHGQWEAAGNHAMPDGEAIEAACGSVGGHVRVIHWIEIEIPVPVPQTTHLGALPANEQRPERKET